MKYFLAVDIGASSGRHMLTHMEEDRMVLEEVHRFYNGMTEKNGHKIWDVDTLFEEISKQELAEPEENEFLDYSFGV